MIFAYLTLATALIISITAAVYSILGLTAIFAAAFWPIVIMGGSLEVGKIVATLWLHKYWKQAEIQYKVYLCAAVAILMMLTSMGVFGFLSKAHGDQSLVSGDASAKIAIYDEQIKTERENIDANRKQLAQMDAAVDQIMARSTTEGGADKANAIRRSQARDRTRIAQEITASQQKISKLNTERAPIAAENRKIEAEVGPVKYIAALIYGDNPEANVLEKAVRWVIILIVIVFDPLALTLLLAATKTIEWERGVNIFATRRKKEEDPEELKNDPKEFFDQARKVAQALDTKTYTAPAAVSTIDLDKINRELTDAKVEPELPEIPADEPAESQLTEDQLKQIVDAAQTELPIDKVVNQPTTNPLDRVLAEVERKHSLDDEPSGTDLQKQIMIMWKEDNPTETFKKYRKLKEEGVIDTLPWNDVAYLSKFIKNEKELSNYKKDLELVADNVPPVLSTVTSFGSILPDEATKGDLFLRIDKLPTVLYKFNGSSWIIVDKESTDSYVYDDAYIDYLIERIGSGQYDPDLLSDAEREQIALKLSKG